MEILILLQAPAPVRAVVRASVTTLLTGLTSISGESAGVDHMAAILRKSLHLAPIRPQRAASGPRILDTLKAAMLLHHGVR